MNGHQQRYEHGSEDFPILYERDGVRIYKNPSDEIFIKDTESGVTMRFSRSHYPGGGLSFTTDGFVDPIRVTNMIGWRVHNRAR